MCSERSADGATGRLAALRRRHGDFDVVDEETVVSRDLYADCRRAAQAGTLGGARAFVRDGARVALLRYDRDPEVWDLPGGSTDRGESFAATAVRHVHRDAGVTVEITGVARVLRETFALVAGGDGVTGVWVFFDAETDDCLSPGADVADAAWFDPADAPDAVDPQVAAHLDDVADE